MRLSSNDLVLDLRINREFMPGNAVKAQRRQALWLSLDGTATKQECAYEVPFRMDCTNHDVLLMRTRFGQNAASLRRRRSVEDGKFAVIVPEVERSQVNFPRCERSPLSQAQKLQRPTTTASESASSLFRSVPTRWAACRSLSPGDVLASNAIRICRSSLLAGNASRRTV